MHDFVTNEDQFKYCYFALGASLRGFRSYLLSYVLLRLFEVKLWWPFALCRCIWCKQSLIFLLHLQLTAVKITSHGHISWWTWRNLLVRLKRWFLYSTDILALHTSWNLFFQKHTMEHDTTTSSWTFLTSSRRITVRKMYLALYVFGQFEFPKYFTKFKTKDHVIANYLKSIDFAKRSQTYFPGHRSKVITRNYTESFNNTTRDTKSGPSYHSLSFFDLQSNSGFMTGVRLQWHEQLD